jgi:hypothetical protein
MLKRFAIAAALLICAGLLPIQGVHAATHSSQATVVAQASLPPLPYNKKLSIWNYPKGGKILGVINGYAKHFLSFQGVSLSIGSSR